MSEGQCAGEHLEALFLDLDGVLTDFYGAAMEAFGRHRSERFRPFPQDYMLHKHLGVSQEEFWHKCNGHRFWSNLRWTEDGIDILKAVEDYCPHEKLYIMTHPSRDAGSYSGKYAWVSEHMPKYRGRLVLTGHKHLLARPGHALIDDCEANVNNFINGGGCALLIPQPWNRLHKLVGGVSVVKGVVNFLKAHNF